MVKINNGFIQGKTIFKKSWKVFRKCDTIYITISIIK